MKGKGARRTLAVATTAVFLMLVVLASMSWGIAAGGIQKVSVTAGGTQGNNESQYGVLSVGETYAVFCSRATNLVAAANNGKMQVFRKDLTNGAIACVSLNWQGKPANADCESPCVSYDGRYVAYDTNASNMVPTGSNSGYTGYGVYRKDLQTGTMLRATSMSGQLPSMSWDGKYIAFQSYDSPWALDCNGNKMDVFRYDCNSDTMLGVSCPVVDFVSPNFYYTGNDDSGYASISLDGSSVAFSSEATNMVPNDHNNIGGAAILFQNGSDVFRKDMNTGAVMRCSTSSAGVECNRDSDEAAISPDGRYVYFMSMAYNLVPGDTDINMINSGRLGQEIFRKDTQTGQTVRCCTSATGVAANNEIQAASVNASGLIIAFSTAANNLVSGDTNGKMDVFVKDLGTGKITKVTAGNGNSGYYGWWAPSINFWGTRVVFASDATNLVTGDTNAKTDIFYKAL